MPKSTHSSPLPARKGQDWYTGTLTDHTARDLKLPLGFLEIGSYQAEVYQDAADVSQYPNHLLKEIKTVTRKDVLDLKLASGGGAVIHFRKL